jgi:hypothetical protein
LEWVYVFLLINEISFFFFARPPPPKLSFIITISLQNHAKLSPKLLNFISLAPPWGAISIYWEKLILIKRKQKRTKRRNPKRKRTHAEDEYTTASTTTLKLSKKPKDCNGTIIIIMNTRYMKSQPKRNRQTSDIESQVEATIPSLSYIYIYIYIMSLFLCLFIYIICILYITYIHTCDTSYDFIWKNVSVGPNSSVELAQSERLDYIEPGQINQIH